MRVFFLFLLAVFFQPAFTQDRCATPVPSEEEIDHFESWMKSKRTQQTLFADHNQTEVYIIPVVVHVIHKGEPIGTGYNISTQRIVDQIDILNQDFRKANPRAVNVPGIFQPVEADIQIEFILARQTPEGNPTTGIIRKQGSRNSYNYPTHDALLKSESYWSSTDYLNIWVADVSVLGWATYPEASGLPGLSPDTNPLTDGVVVDAMWFGYNPTTGGSFASFGQTATHEIGHYLGLRHIWGDGGCSADDFCIDTPAASTDNGGLGDPCTFPGPNTCNVDTLPDMFMNYMDYTNDECMNMFTADQRFRMRTVMENSPRRVSLRSSPALEYPIGAFDVDMTIVSMESIPVAVCDATLSTQITLGNFGSETISSFTLNYTLNAITENLSISGLALQTGEEYQLELPTRNLDHGGNTLSLSITSVNGSTDENELNNSQTRVVHRSDAQMDTPFRELFLQTNNWILTAPKGVSEWENSNGKMKVDAFRAPSNTKSWLVSPSFSLTNFEKAGLFFSLSYAMGDAVDGLEVRLASECSGTFELIWSDALDQLGFGESSTSWEPEVDEHWREIFINLTPYVHQENVRLAFVFINNGGNNLYIDAIELTNNNLPNQPRPKLGSMITYPNPAENFFNLTLSVSNPQSVKLQLINMSGQVVMEQHFTDVLNQTFKVDTGQLFGTYFLRVTGKDINRTQRILIGG